MSRVPSSYRRSHTCSPRKLVKRFPSPNTKGEEALCSETGNRSDALVLWDYYWKEMRRAVLQWYGTITHLLQGSTVNSVDQMGQKGLGCILSAKSSPLKILCLKNCEYFVNTRNINPPQSNWTSISLRCALAIPDRHSEDTSENSWQPQFVQRCALTP